MHWIALGIVVFGSLLWWIGYLMGFDDGIDNVLEFPEEFPELDDWRVAMREMRR